LLEKKALSNICDAIKIGIKWRGRYSGGG
jgi:hypothetical protein